MRPGSRTPGLSRARQRDGPPSPPPPPGPGRAAASLAAPAADGRVVLAARHWHRRRGAPLRLSAEPLRLRLSPSPTHGTFSHRGHRAYSGPRAGLRPPTRPGRALRGTADWLLDAAATPAPPTVSSHRDSDCQWQAGRSAALPCIRRRCQGLARPPGGARDTGREAGLGFCPSLHPLAMTFGLVGGPSRLNSLLCSLVYTIICQVVRIPDAAG
jgi:hypothetical protein